ncbi:MAG: aldo/keto reductase family protein [Opitutales bacterium]
MKQIKLSKLANGSTMPSAAYGTFHSDWAQDMMYDATLEAIRVGWRHLDTARAYENEDVVGAAIQEAIKRGYISSVDELFITGKLWNGHMDPKDVAPALESTLKNLGIEQIDCYLNHWPWPNVHPPGCTGDQKNPNAVPYIHEAFMETWAELLKLKQAGKIVDLGVSNHTKACLDLLLRDTADDERPVVNQMEMHPLFQQTELRQYFEKNGVATMGYMALGSPHRPSRDNFKEHRSDMDDPIIVEVAREIGITPGEVCLAWAAQRENASGGFVAMSTNPGRIYSNLKCAIKDYLSPEQLLRISGDGTEENPGICANNRLIWGQVFLWEEAGNDWRVLWDDSQIFETRANYARFKKSWADHNKCQLETTYRPSGAQF